MMGVIRGSAKEREQTEHLQRAIRNAQMREQRNNDDSDGAGDFLREAEAYEKKKEKKKSDNFLHSLKKYGGPLNMVTVSYDELDINARKLEKYLRRDVHMHSEFVDRFHAYHNELERLPLQPALHQLFPGLKHLQLNKNHLEYLPDSISSLVNLESLAVGYNRLAYLPRSLCTLKRLSVLQVYSNQLVHLPASIGDCPLRIIEVDHNPLQWLPVTLSLLRIPQSGRLVLQSMKLPYYGIPYGRWNLETHPRVPNHIHYSMLQLMLVLRRLGIKMPRDISLLLLSWVCTAPSGWTAALAPAKEK